MRIHLLAVPNTQTTAAYPLDGFCVRTMLFAALLKRLGHEVVLYGVHANEAPCDGFVSCMSADEQRGFVGDTPYQAVPFEAGSPLFDTFNKRAAQHLRSIKQPGDVIATIAGSAQHFVSEHHPELRFLEYSIGYAGVCAPFRVFQSQAWRHLVHGFTRVDSGRDFDAVIPPWFNVADFPFTDQPNDYVAYCGRLTAVKGLKTVCDAAREAGVPLIVMGHGDPSLVTYGEYVGDVPMEERNRLLSGAKAVLMPTQYIEPFGNVSAEAQLCGTPVISTDFGAFTESVEHGVTGFRCTSLGEFVQAIDLAGDLDRRAIRRRAERLYSTDAAAVAYTGYFRRLETVGQDGWRDLNPGLETAGLAMSSPPDASVGAVDACTSSLT